MAVHDRLPPTPPPARAVRLRRLLAACIAAASVGLPPAATGEGMGGVRFRGEGAKPVSPPAVPGGFGRYGPKLLTDGTRIDTTSREPTTWDLDVAGRLSPKSPCRSPIRVHVSPAFRYALADNPTMRWVLTGERVPTRNPDIMRVMSDENLHNAHVYAVSPKFGTAFDGEGIYSRSTALFAKVIIRISKTHTVSFTSGYECFFSDGPVIIKRLTDLIFSK